MTINENNVGMQHTIARDKIINFKSTSVNTFSNTYLQDEKKLLHAKNQCPLNDSKEHLSTLYFNETSEVVAFK